MLSGAVRSIVSGSVSFGNNLDRKLSLYQYRIIRSKKNKTKKSILQMQVCISAIMRENFNLIVGQIFCFLLFSFLYDVQC